MKNNLEKTYTANLNNLPFELNEKALLNPSFIKSKQYDSKKEEPFLKLKNKNQTIFEKICYMNNILNGNTFQI